MAEPPLRLWTVVSPRALYCTMFAVLTELVEHKMTAVGHISRYAWDIESTAQPTWMRAHHNVNNMADTGIGPMMQHMGGLIHIFMATPGPREGTYLGSRVIASQVKDALKNRNAHAGLLESPTIDEMVDVLNSKESEWRRRVRLDADMEDVGAYAVPDEARVRGMRQGKFHLADSGMNFVGRRTPNIGYRNAFDVMQEYVGFVHLGAESHVKGGHRIQAMAQRFKKSVTLQSMRLAR